MQDWFRKDLRGPFVVELLRAGTRLEGAEILKGMRALKSFDDLLTVFPQLTRGNAFSRAAEEAERVLAEVVARKILCRTFFDPAYPSVFRSFPSPPSADLLLG